MLEQLHGTVWYPTAFSSRSMTREPSLNGSLDNKINDCDHNESDRTEISQQNIGTNSYVTRYGRVIKKPVRFGDTE